MSARLAKSIIIIVKLKFHNGKNRKNGSKKKGNVDCSRQSFAHSSPHKKNDNQHVCFIAFSLFCFPIKGCYRKSNIGNTEIKNGIETERTDFLDLVSQLLLNVFMTSVCQHFAVACGPIYAQYWWQLHKHQAHKKQNAAKLIAQRKFQLEIIGLSDCVTWLYRYYFISCRASVF